MNLLKLLFSAVIVLIVLISSLSQFGCDIKEPTAPEWDITGNLPIINRYYFIYDMLKNSTNTHYDSVNSNVILTGTTATTDLFSDIKSDGVGQSFYNVPTNLSHDTTIFIYFDDSTQASFISFLSGELILKFQGAALNSYTVNLSLENMRSRNDTTLKYTNTVQVPANTQKQISIPLFNWVYKSNGGVSNIIALKLRTTSSTAEIATLSSEVTPYTVERIIGRIKPTYIARELSRTDSPFGTDVPEGFINFASVDEDYTYITLKRYENNYQLDFEQVSIQGINKNGNKVNLRYNPGGNPTINDTLFNLSLDQGSDSSNFYLTNLNSNVAEFIGNLPKDIYVAKTILINKPYSNGSINYLDSFSTNTNFSVPINMYITQTNSVIQDDTADFGISDEDQRKKIQNCQSMDIELIMTNAIALFAISKIDVLDSFNVPLFSLSRMLGNPSDSTISVSRAPVDINGFVNGISLQTYRTTVPKEIIDKILRAGKVVYVTKFYTDQNPTSYIRVVKNDYARLLGIGKVIYRIKED
ncbi:MAG: hypothetical protein WC139_11560 [Candidatus Kapaibacterium sp.]